MAPTLSIVCCGRFHYDSYLGALEGHVDVRAFYYSYRLSHRVRAKKTRLVNLWRKEYLLGIHLRIFGRRGLRYAMPFFHWVWKIDLARSFAPTQVNLFLLHGNCRWAIERAKASGGVIICEAVNAHPDHLHEVLTAERRDLGLPPQQFTVANRDQILEELRLADFLLCPSTAVANSYVGRGFDPDRVLVCPYGVPEMTFEQRKTVPAKPSLLVVAQLDVRKGIHLLLDALAADAEMSSKVDVTIVGKGDSSYLRKLREIYPQARYIEHISSADMLNYMSKFSMTCLPSLEDGFGLVVLESLAAGVPVIVSKYAGAADFVRTYGGGIVVDPRSAGEVSSAIRRLLAGDFQRMSGALPSWSDYARNLAEHISTASRVAVPR